MKTLQPTNGFVLIKIAQTEEQTAGGIILPDNAKEKLTEGDVVNIAPGASDEIAIGDRVIYKQYTGTEINYDGADHLLIPAGDILAKYMEVDEI